MLGCVVTHVHGLGFVYSDLTVEYYVGLTCLLHECQLHDWQNEICGFRGHVSPYGYSDMLGFIWLYNCH